MTHRRTFLKGFAAAGALSVADTLAALHAAWAEGNKPVSPGIQKITGTVTINGKPAKEGMAVNMGDTLVTGPGSEVIYVIGQDAYLQRDNSTVILGGDRLKSGLRLLSGKLLGVFGKGDKHLETKTATIGIRGTGCYLEAEESRTYVCLCYGVADLSPSEAPERREVVKTTHHESPKWVSSSGVQPITAAPMINHTDAELELLEALVGRQPPFSGKSTAYRY